MSEIDTTHGWEELAARSGQLPTQDAPWALAAFDAFDGVPEIVLQGDPGAPSAVAALVENDGWLELAGATTGEPCDLLSSSPGALGELAETLVADGRPILLPRLPGASPTIAALREAIGRRGVVRVSNSSGYPTIELGEQWAEPGGGLSKSRRSALRRSRRRAEKAGDVAVELLTPAPEEVEGLLDVAFDVEARSWKGAAGTALVHDPALADFVRRYAAETAARGTLRVELLRIAEQPVAMQIGIEWRNRIWLFKIGYDEAHAASSPGQLLLAESIADATRRGLERYELLGTAAPWTEIWTSTVNPSVRVAVYPPSRQGLTRLGVAAAGQARTQARERLRATVNAAETVVASRYVVGPGVGDALREEARCAAAGYATTIGYWGAEETSGAELTKGCFEAVERLRDGSQLSVKLTAMEIDDSTLDDLLQRCQSQQIGLHLDALAPETAEQTLREAQRLGSAAPGTVGCTLPGRWARSVGDAADVGPDDLRVRVVKGEWEDPDDPERDARDGYMDVVDALAGRAQQVAIATQDAPLATTALERLVAAGTPTELQVLFGMPCRAAVKAARELSVPVRVYVPYGTGRVPYEIERRVGTVARFAFDLQPLISFTPPGVSPVSSD